LHPIPALLNSTSRRPQRWYATSSMRWMSAAQVTSAWTEAHRDARALAWRLAGAGPFQTIVCVTRGGLVPAAIVGRELGIWNSSHETGKAFCGCGC
jgi:hypothetical protein